MYFEIKKGNIIKAKVDAIVNSSNNSLTCSEGLCAAIFEEAGYEDLKRECNLYPYCQTGKSVITYGYSLNAKHIIHTVGPNYCKNTQPNIDLKNAYLSSLKLADENNLKTIAFPCISTGFHEFPLKEACLVALKAIKNYIPQNLEKCYLYCYNKKEYLMYKKLLQKPLY